MNRCAVCRVEVHSKLLCGTCKRSYNRAIARSTTTYSVIKWAASRARHKHQPKRRMNPHQETNMDPNATLKEIRSIVAESNTSGELPDEDSTERLIELFTALDNWIDNGGFLPKAWAR